MTLSYKYGASRAAADPRPSRRPGEAMTPAAHEFLHEVLAKTGDECRICTRRGELTALLGARIRDMQIENLFCALFACPCCYDGAARVSTGTVLGGKCVVCDGTGRRPKFDPEEASP